MASVVPPVKGVGFSFPAYLVSQADTDVFQSNPTLAAGDVKVSKDNGTSANIATLPTATGERVWVTLSNDEANADVIAVEFKDAAGDEWQSVTYVIYTAAQTLDTVDANVDSILADTGTDGVPLTAAAVDAILDEAVEGSYTLRQLLRLMSAALFGKASGGGTTSIKFRDTADGTDRITATVDAQGNRTAVVLDAG